jgi:hypothetical protein
VSGDRDLIVEERTGRRIGRGWDEPLDPRLDEREPAVPVDPDSGRILYEHLLRLLVDRERLFDVHDRRALEEERVVVLVAVAGPVVPGIAAPDVRQEVVRVHVVVAPPEPEHVGRVLAQRLEVGPPLLAFLGDRDAEVLLELGLHEVHDVFVSGAGVVPEGETDLAGVGQSELSVMEVADTVVFLLSDRASWINGANIPISGAWGI